MTEVWQYAIPVTIALGSLFHFLMADLFTSIREEKPLVIVWIGFAFLLMMDAIFSAHLIAQDTTSADLTTATRVAYIIFLVSVGYSAVYAGVVGIRTYIGYLTTSGKKWLK